MDTRTVSLGGAATGATVGFLLTYATTGDLQQALYSAGISGVTGLISGAAGGFAKGVAYKRAINKLPNESPERMVMKETKLPQSTNEGEIINDGSTENIVLKNDLLIKSVDLDGNSNYSINQKPTNVKLISSNALKAEGLDAHTIKGEFIGRNNISKFDLYRDTNTGEILIFGKGGKGVPMNTGYFIYKK